jgi:4-oxalocrotonate tautomerase
MNFEGEEEMPFVNVKVIEGVFSGAQKEAMVKELTDAMVRIEGENMRQVTWVVIEEVRSGSWAIGASIAHYGGCESVSCRQSVSLIRTV